MKKISPGILTSVLALSATLLVGGVAAEGNIHFPRPTQSLGVSVPSLLGQAANMPAPLNAPEPAPTSEAPEGGAEVAQPAEVASETVAEEAEDALGFLRRLEEKNADIKSLNGKFRQVRTSSIFLEEIQSRGEFWYSRPDLFRCDYFEPSELRYYLVDNTAWIYTPELNQVDKIAMERGDGAAINQLLVGFGLDVDVILDVFDVAIPEKQPAQSNRLAIEFTSKDLDRSLGYSRIQVTFDRELLEPRVLEMEQEDDTIVVRLDSVQRDVPVEVTKFKPEFPPNVEIHEF